MASEGVRNTRWFDRLLFVLLLVLVVPLEYAAAKLAYHTLGEITSALYLLAIGINLPLLVLAFWRPRIASVGAIVLAFLILPYQVYLGDRLRRVQDEAARIVCYAYEARQTSGTFPSDLSGYRFTDPAMQPFIQDYETRSNGASFHLTFRVGTENTSHWYGPEGGWGYYPD